MIMVRLGRQQESLVILFHPLCPLMENIRFSGETETMHFFPLIMEIHGIQS